MHHLIKMIVLHRMRNHTHGHIIHICSKWILVIYWRCRSSSVSPVLFPAVNTVVSNVAFNCYAHFQLRFLFLGIHTKLWFLYIYRYARKDFSHTNMFSRKKERTRGARMPTISTIYVWLISSHTYATLLLGYRTERPSFGQIRWDFGLTSYSWMWALCILLGRRAFMLECWV